MDNGGYFVGGRRKLSAKPGSYFSGKNDVENIIKAESIKSTE
jgi:hypothetical protein